MGLAMLVSGPLHSFANSLAHVETIRDRLYLRPRGLSLPKSTCCSTAADLARMNWLLLSGARGYEAVAEFSEILEVHPDSELIEPFGNTFVTCF